MVNSSKTLMTISIRCGLQMKKIRDIRELDLLQCQSKNQAPHKLDSKKLLLPPTRISVQHDIGYMEREEMKVSKWNKMRMQIKMIVVNLKQNLFQMRN